MVSVLSARIEDLLGEGDRPKELRAGTHRTACASDTLDRIRPHFDRVGITRLGDITGLDRIGIPVAQAVRPMARSLSVSQGKGATADLARVSAAMEALEKWHAENLMLAMDVERPSVLRKRGRLLATTRRDPKTGAPRALDDVPMRVVEGHDLVSGEGVFVPMDQVTMDYTVPPDQSMVLQSSNGLASGNTLAEALASAFFEVIERDCLADFDALGAARQRAKRVPVDWCRKAGAGREVGAILSAGLGLTVWDISNDLGIPAFSAALTETGVGRLGPGASGFGGSGCHLDPSIALLRALHEAAQSRATAIAGAREDLERSAYARPQRARVPDFDLLFSAPPSHVPSLADQSEESSLGDVKVILNKLRAAGCQDLAFVNLSRDEIGVNVVRVVAPELGLILPGHVHTRGTRHFVK